MTIEIQTEDNLKICKISGALSIWDAADSWRQIHSLLKSRAKTPVQFELSELDQCDGAGLQILCQIRRAVEKKSDKFRIAGLSESLAAIFNNAGINTQSMTSIVEEA